MISGRHLCGNKCNLHSREDLRCLLRPVRDCIDRLLDPSPLEAEPVILEAVVANALSLCVYLCVCVCVKVEEDLVMIGHSFQQRRIGRGRKKKRGAGNGSFAGGRERLLGGEVGEKSQ